MTQRIELFSEWLKDFVENDSKNQTFLNMTQRIELLFIENMF